MQVKYWCPEGKQFQDYYNPCIHYDGKQPCGSATPWGVIVAMAAIALIGTGILSQTLPGAVSHSSLLSASSSSSSSGSSSSSSNKHPKGSGIVGGPSLSAAFVDRLLAYYTSPAQGEGQDVYALSQQYQIDDAFVMAIFQHESTMGRYGAATATLSPGNLNCSSYSPTCIGRFASFRSWGAGFAALYKLLRNEYVNGRGMTTAWQIFPVYAPSSDNNDPVGYANAVVSLMNTWRAGRLA